MNERYQLQEIVSQSRVWCNLSEVLFYEKKFFGTVDLVVEVFGYFYFTSEVVTEELLKNLQFFGDAFSMISFLLLNF